MKIIMLFDQTQAGKGGKGNTHTPLAAEKGGIGSYLMFEKEIKEIGGNVLATIYCGDGTFIENKDEVTEKIKRMVVKLNPDVLICGPAFNYPNYSLMCAYIANEIENTTNVRSFAMMSEENEMVIKNYKSKIRIVKMPKKGGTGLSQSLENMAIVAHTLVNNENEDKIIDLVYS